MIKFMFGVIFAGVSLLLMSVVGIVFWTMYKLNQEESREWDYLNYRDPLYPRKTEEPIGQINE